jgi:ABC-type antimicrobial peptide transport system permease subunit
MTRVGALQLEFASDRLFAEYFLYLLLTISVIIIIIITKKRIEDERLQIGVLKSLGYNKFSIAASYLVYPIIGSLIGGTLGFILGNVFSEPIATILRSYYTVPLTNYKISFDYLKTSILTPMLVLSILSYIIALIMLRKKPLQLLREGSNLKVNIFSKLVNKITRLLPFNSRFKYSLAFRSIGKLFIVTITSFLTGLLLTLILIGSNLFNNVIDKSFGGMDYKYMAYFNGINTSDKKDPKSDYILNETLYLDKITTKDNKDKKVDDETNISIYGIDLDSKYIKVLDKKEKDMKPLLKDKDGVIVSRNVKENLDIEIGDILTFKYEELEFTYKVIGFNEEFMGFSVYVNRESLAEKNKIAPNSYSLIYSNSEKYSEMSKLDKEESEQIAYLMNLEDLKENIEKQMDRFNGSVYIVIFFASLMALIIIMVIANIVVEENKKTISLMKVLGYENKRISKIVLNIYTPFIIIAYLISIPVMTKILKMIVKALLGDTKITIPIEADPVMLGFGLIGLLAAYYLALALSKKVLNKIPLAIALKRE